MSECFSSHLNVNREGFSAAFLPVNVFGACRYFYSNVVPLTYVGNGVTNPGSRSFGGNPVPDSMVIAPTSVIYGSDRTENRFCYCPSVSIGGNTLFYVPYTCLGNIDFVLNYLVSDPAKQGKDSGNFGSDTVTSSGFSFTNTGNKYYTNGSSVGGRTTVETIQNVSGVEYTYLLLYR